MFRARDAAKVATSYWQGFTRMYCGTSGFRIQQQGNPQLAAQPQAGTLDTRVQPPLELDAWKVPINAFAYLAGGMQSDEDDAGDNARDYYAAPLNTTADDHADVDLAVM